MREHEHMGSEGQVGGETQRSEKATISNYVASQNALIPSPFRGSLEFAMFFLSTKLTSHRPQREHIVRERAVILFAGNPKQQTGWNHVKGPFRGANPFCGKSKAEGRVGGIIILLHQWRFLVWSPSIIILPVVVWARD
jgi:hypothetical protein